MDHKAELHVAYLSTCNSATGQEAIHTQSLRALAYNVLEKYKVLGKLHPWNLRESNFCNANADAVKIKNLSLKLEKYIH